MDSTGYRLITDDDGYRPARQQFDMPENKIRRAFSAKTSVFNKFTREKECSIACLRLALAQLLDNTPAIVHGFGGLLIPQTVSHGLRVCLIAEMPYRIPRRRRIQGPVRERRGEAHPQRRCQPGRLDRHLALFDRIPGTKISTTSCCP
jgi:two-component system response regulator CpxR